MQSVVKRVRSELKRLYKVYVEEGVMYRLEQERFYRIFGGHIFFQALATAVELDLFQKVADAPGITEEQLRAELELGEQPFRILLLALVSSGLLHREYNHLSCTRLTRRFLLNDSPWKTSACVRWQSHINYRPLGHLQEAVRAGTNIGLQEIEGRGDTLYERLASHPKLERIFQEAMQELSTQSNPLLPQFLTLRPTARLLDIGGGNGTNLVRLKQTYPLMQGAVFDSPTICAQARENFQSHGYASDLGAVAGDIRANQIPEGFTEILFCHFMTIWSKDEILAFLKKAYQALPPGGRTIIFNMMQHDTGDGPLTAALGSPYFLTLATGRGMLYTWNEYKTLLQLAGFKTVTTTVLPRDHGLIIGEK